MARTRLRIDAAFKEEEQRRDPIEVEIPGLGVFTLPGSMNALATMRVARWAEQGKTEIGINEAVLLLGDILPDDVLLQWHRDGFDLFDPDNGEIVEQVVLVLMEEYQRRAEAVSTADPGKARTVAMTPPTFSGTGPWSEPTSDGSTGSPFPVT